MCQFPRTIKVPLQTDYGRSHSDPSHLAPTVLTVPCGHCLECLKLRSNQWCFRMIEERKNWQYCSFVTLTYSDEYLPIAVRSGDSVYIKHGRNNPGQSTLYIRDVQNFFKRLRKDLTKLYATRLSYVVVGEYGFNNTLRPHYHCIIYHNNCTSIQLRSLISENWFNGCRVDCRSASEGALRYVSKYITTVCPSRNTRWQRPFFNASRRPAIGYSFIFSPTADYLARQAKTVILHKFINKQGQTCSYLLPLPRYYREKMDYRPMTHEEYNSFASQRNLSNSTKVPPSTTFICDGQLEVTRTYYHLCEDSFFSLVRQHDKRDEEQHIKFSFNDYLYMVHDFELVRKQYYNFHKSYFCNVQSV